jgi:hypothetical protein
MAYLASHPCTMGTTKVETYLSTWRLAMAITPFYSSSNASTSLQPSLQIDRNPKMALSGSGTRIDLVQSTSNNSAGIQFDPHNLQMEVSCGQTCITGQAFTFQGALLETLLVPAGSVLLRQPYRISADFSRYDQSNPGQRYHRRFVKDHQLHRICHEWCTKQIGCTQ